MNPDLQQLRKKCPLPHLMTGLGLGQYAKPSCPSPFRSDQHSSWGIFETDGRWLYKDFATGECGDEISLLAQFHGLHQKKDFLKLLDLYEIQARSNPQCPDSIAGDPKIRNERPDTSFLGIGNEEQMKRLSDLRHISIQGLQYASERRVLRFGIWQGQDVFAVLDSSGYLAELRRLDGKMFDGYGDLGPHKSHTLKFSRKNWPLGILEAANAPGIALVEGMPDFLAMHQFVVEEGLEGKVGPVAMLTSNCDLAPEALAFFTGKHIRIFPHLDKPGIDAAQRWQKQLMDAKARLVDFFNFQALEFAAGSGVKDLCEFNQQRGEAGIQPQILKGISL